ncbi:MAG TPA: ankyrin repeat domain-containing protein [Acidobacteriaceae bacterium]|nr:ankyrin repeat domain-containing protein [Acidobacteriaceae bacterium]
MLTMLRAAAILALASFTTAISRAQEQPTYPSFDYDAAQSHEIRPHRDEIPTVGIREGLNQLHLTLIVSPMGDVMNAEASGSQDDMKYWSSVEGTVYQWHFKPFEKDGKPITAEVEEYVNLVPPERLPSVRINPPVVHPNSRIAIALERTGCMGSCPGYTVTLTTEGTTFDGGGNVVAPGKHTDTVDPSQVRDFAKEFVAADFYSMDPGYQAMVTDCPTYILSISIDGKEKRIVDYMGTWIGMPEIIKDLENKTDEVAQTSRWIAGDEGLVRALQAEKFDFHTFDAQVMLKAAAQRGQTATVRELLDAGVSLKPIPAPKPKEPYMGIPFDHVGWLNSASSHPDALHVLIDARASRDDQEDKDLALAGAADTGSLDAVRALIAYGANPNVDLSKLTVTESGGGMILQGLGKGSILIMAAGSGNPDLVREILRYKPKLEAKGRDGQTAMFAAGDYRNTDVDGARVECVRLLAEAGANVNARDDDGNTPLHETFLDDVAEELIKLGADVNARNKDGETPLMTTVSNDMVRVLIKHGADPYIRDNDGKTAFDDASRHGPDREPTLRAALSEVTPRQN